MQENNIILYQDDNEITRVSVRFADEDLWLTQNQLADIYCTTQQNISQHVDNIYKDGELTIEATNKKFLLVRQEGNRQVKRNIDHYNLDMIIALGYRVQSQVATRFRRWATQRLHEYIQKGFAMDDERLKQGGNRYFRELLQRIRDIKMLYTAWGILGYGRFDKNERYAVIVNNTQETVNVAVPVWQIGVADGSRMEQQLMSVAESFTKVPDIYVVTDGYLMVAMPRTSAVILKDIG